MTNAFTPIDEEYRQKHYPNGYFESLAKKSGGITLIVCGAVLGLMGLAVGYAAVHFLLDLIHGEGYDGIVGGTIFMLLLALAFLVPGVLLIRFGIRRKGMDADAWIKKSAGASGYPESAVREFAQQAVSSDSIRLQLAGSLDAVSGKGILTRDYILFENLLDLCVIKRSDITGVYLVSLPSTVRVGKQVRTVYNLNVAVFSSHKTSIVTETDRKPGEQLVAMLTEKHPSIDTAGGRVLSAREFEEMRKSSLAGAKPGASAS